VISSILVKCEWRIPKIPVTKRVYKKDDAVGQGLAEFLACHASSLPHLTTTPRSERNTCLSLSFGRLLVALNQQRVLTQKQILSIVGVDAYRDMPNMKIKISDPQLTKQQALHFLKKQRGVDDKLIEILDRAGASDLPSLVRERDQLKRELEEIKNQRMLILHLFLDKELVAVLISKKGQAKIGWVHTDFKEGMTYYVTHGIDFPREHPCKHLNIPVTASSESLIRNIARLYFRQYKFRAIEIVV